MWIPNVYPKGYISKIVSQNRGLTGFKLIKFSHSQSGKSYYAIFVCLSFLSYTQKKQNK